MKRRMLIAIPLLLAIIFALSGCSKPTEPKTEPPTGYPEVIKDRSFAILAPDGIIPNDLIWYLKSKTMDFTVSEPNEDTEHRYEQANVIEQIVEGYLAEHMTDGTKYPDWYGGSYTILEPEYGLNVPYSCDGGTEPFKYCILITPSMESEGAEIRELLKPYEDYIVYKEVKYSKSEREEFLNSTLIPAFKKQGIKGPSSKPYSTQDAVEFTVYEEYFNDETFDFTKQLCNQYGVNIVIARSDDVQ